MPCLATVWAVWLVAVEDAEFSAVMMLAWWMTAVAATTPLTEAVTEMVRLPG